MFSANVFDAKRLELAEKMDQSPAAGVNGSGKANGEDMRAKRREKKMVEKNISAAVWPGFLEVRQSLAEKVACRIAPPW